MGFFSKIFGSKEPRREHWVHISLEIAQSLKEVRELWFKACVELLRDPPEQDGEPVEFTIKRTDLADDAEHALKAFQLYLVAMVLNQHRYILQSRGKDFADILFSQVFGIDLEEGLKWFKNYLNAEKERALGMFSLDIAGHITGGKYEAPHESLIGSVIISTHLFLQLAGLVHMAVADAFDDRKTYNELKENLNLW